jgi:two-component system, NtrC family, response regulator HydG
MEGDASAQARRGNRVLVADDDAQLRAAIVRLLASRGFSVDTAEDGSSALEKVSSRPYDVVLTDLRMPGRSGIDVVSHVQREGLPCKVIVMTAVTDGEARASAVRAGAFAFLEKPFPSADALTLAVRNAADAKRLREETRELQRRLATPRPSPILARCPAMLEVFRVIAGVAPTQATVLVLGETGTGKELVARAVHDASRRAAGPFETINCAAIPAELLESELFGHVRGAFTSAHRDRAGAFESAHGGTIFLDEIGDMALDAQAKLLRVLQSGEVRAIGSDQAKTVDVRVVAATHVDLKAAVAAGTFRQDLYYRLNVISVRLPPLRDRADDVLLLAHHFIARYAEALGREPLTLGEAATAAVTSYRWPGNVRELDHAMERSVLLETSTEIQLQALPEDVRGAAARAPSIAPGGKKVLGASDLLTLPYMDAKRELNARFKAWYAHALLDAAGGNVSEASRRAGLDRSNFRKLLRTGKG